MSVSEKTPRILLVRLSAIGDVVHAMPIACALREHFPQAFWPGPSRARGRACRRPPGYRPADRAASRLAPLAGRVYRLRKQLKELAFDTAIDAQGLTKSAALAWLSGARRRIGMGGLGPRDSRWLNNELVDTDGLHAIERRLNCWNRWASNRLPCVLKCPPPQRISMPPRSGPTPGAGERIRPRGIGGRLAVEALARRALRGRGRLLGAGWNMRSLLIWGNDAERARAEQVIAAAEGHACSPENHALAVGRDCPPGPFCDRFRYRAAHLAAAAGTPCIGLYGPWPADKHGPYGPQHINLQTMCMDGTTHQRRHAPSITWRPSTWDWC